MHRFEIIFNEKQATENIDVQNQQFDVGNCKIWLAFSTKLKKIEKKC